MIVVNWGSSKFRAYRLNAEYTNVAEKSSGKGASKVEGGKFQEALFEEVGDWIRDGENRILMCGMVGSRYGWKEVPYVTLPASIEEICDGVVSQDLEALDVRIVPGLLGRDTSGISEVMRGEETEIIGSQNVAEHQIICLPGTHTKWTEAKRGMVVSFSTYMTGELFHAVQSATILARSISADADDSGFDRGVMRAKEPGGLLHHLFGVRSMVLTGALRDESASSYLSGLLIGHEVKEAVSESVPVHLVGEVKLCMLYARARAFYGGPSTVEPKGADMRGLVAIARRLLW